MTVGQIRRAIKYDLARGHRLTHILKALRMPKSTCHFWRHHKPTRHYKHDVHYRRLMTTIWYENHKIYGFMRIRAYLRRYKKIRIGTDRAWRLAHELGLRSIMNKKYVKPHTHNDYPQRPNLIKNHDWSNAWCGDITYIRLTTGKWVFLASVYNPNTHHIVAYKISPHMTDELVTEVMKMALKTTSSDRHPTIMHTDMGSQYTSYQFENYLLKHGILHSYSRKGYPYDNTYIENFHSILKREWVFPREKYYRNIYIVRVSIGYYIRWYNTKRIRLAS